MEKKEPMEFAVKGIEVEIRECEKSIRNGERLLRPYREGFMQRNEKMVVIEKRIGELQEEIKVLENKLFDLRWELENGTATI